MPSFGKPLAIALGAIVLSGTVMVPYAYALAQDYVSQPAAPVVPAVLQQQAQPEAPAPVVADDEDSPAPAPAVQAAPDAELNCLAKIVVHEAGNQSRTGQLAVAQVVMNRVRSGRFANDDLRRRPRSAASSSMSTPTIRRATRAGAAPWIAHDARERDQRAGDRQCVVLPRGPFQFGLLQQSPPGRPDRQPRLLSLRQSPAARISPPKRRSLSDCHQPCSASTGRSRPSAAAASNQVSAAMTICAPQRIRCAADRTSRAMRLRVEQRQNERRHGNDCARPAQTRAAAARAGRADRRATRCGRGRWDRAAAPLGARSAPPPRPRSAGFFARRLRGLRSRGTRGLPPFPAPGFLRPLRHARPLQN